MVAQKGFYSDAKRCNAAAKRRRLTAIATNTSQVLTHTFRVKICWATSKLLNAFLVNTGLLLVMHILNTRVSFVLEERSPLPFAQARPVSFFVLFFCGDACVFRTYVGIT